MTGFNIELIAGQSYCLTTTLTDSSNVAINLTNYVVRGGAKFNYSDASYAINFNPTISSAVSGIILISLSGYMTSGLKSTIMPYDIEAAQTGVSGDSNVYKTLRGYLYVWPETSF